LDFKLILFIEHMILTNTKSVFIIR